MEIGKRLQEERLNQGISLEEVKSETKIQTRYLTAIEENDWSKMPEIFMCVLLYVNMLKF